MATDTAEPAEPNDPHVLEPGHAPTPFTAAEIRDGCRAGRTVRLLIEPADEAPSLRINVFVDCDDEGPTIEATRLTIDGTPLGPPEPRRTTWLELQGHASFPLEQTTIERVVIETPLGLLDCLRYTVRDESSVGTFWFAKDRPGMPVKYTDEQDGRLTSTVTMIGDTRQPPGT